jgi:aspartate racemase
MADYSETGYVSTRFLRKAGAYSDIIPKGEYMKVIGLIGGMSWESSAEYYKLINRRIKDVRGGYSSAKCLMYSVDFAEIEALQSKDKWDEAGALLADAAKRLEAGGADFILLCTNTMHKVADAIQNSVSIPFVHIADATCEAVKAQGLKKVALLGTRYTMEQDFYKQRLIDNGLEVIVPEKADRNTVHNIIYEELVRGEVKYESKLRFQTIINCQKKRGAEGVILGCTEIGLLIKPDDSPLPVFDTTEIHAHTAAELALK